MIVVKDLNNLASRNHNNSITETGRVCKHVPGRVERVFFFYIFFSSASTIRVAAAGGDNIYEGVDITYTTV